MRRYIGLTLYLSMILVMTTQSGVAEAGAGAAKRIGILLFSKEIRYVETAKGFVDQLKKEGFSGDNIKITTEYGEGNKAILSEYVRQFASAKMDLIVSIGTSATAIALRDIPDVPIVFSMVYDPVESGFAKSWKSSGNNSTGASSKVPFSRIFESLKLFPNIKKLAVLYTPAEKNSMLQLKDLKEIRGKFQIEIIPVPIVSSEEIGQVLPDVIRSSDAIFVTGSNTVGSQIQLVIDMATKAKVVTITHLDDLVEKGILLGICADAYDMGMLVGKKAAKILKGAKPSSIPIETAKVVEVVLNMRTVTAGQYHIPPALMKRVTKKVN